MYRIDSHQHFWQLSRGDYSWLTPDLKLLYKDFLPQDIQSYLKQANIDKTMLVQASDTTAETEFMLSLAQQHDFIGGVVGWIDMESTDAIDQLSRLKTNAVFKGIRPMIQDIEDTDWMLKAELTPVFNALVILELTFDALVLPQHLANLQILLKRHPKLNVVIDHGAKPNIAQAAGVDIAESINKNWAEDIKNLSTYPNVYCKLSGLVTEAGEQPSYEHIEPYMSHLLSCFGADKLMWGSDWPVVNLSSDYLTWTDYVAKFIGQLSEQEQRNILADTAQHFYNIERIKG